MFTVVIPTYNSGAKIVEPIRSLNAQSFKNFTVDFIDDCSPEYDDLVATITREARFDYRIRQLPSHINQVASRHTGTVHATEDYVCFLDHDDAWAPEKLAVMRDCILANDNRENTLFYHRLFCRYDDGLGFCYPNRGIAPSERVADYLFLRNGMIQSSSMVLSRSAACRVFFDHTSPPHDDWSFALQVEKAGLAFAFVDNVLATWNVRRMAGRSQRDSAAVSLSWLQRNENNFSGAARTAFLVNIVLPKLIAEQRVSAALRLFFSETHRNPTSAIISSISLAHRMVSKFRRTRQNI